MIAGRHRPRLTILFKLLIAFVVPTVVLFAVFATYAYEVTRRDLEAELGRRLAAVASSAATQIRGRYLVELEAGDEGDRGYLNVMRKLRAVREATDVGRIYIFDQRYVSRADTADRMSIGEEYFESRLDRHELARVFERGDAVSTLLFTGEDGRPTQAGYAPIRRSERDPDIVLVLGVDAPATYLTRLASLRRSLLLFGALLAFVVLAISIVVATLITRPVRKLVDAAERIGRGDLEADIERTSHDEIGFLAETMQEMRQGLRARDERMQMMLAGIAHEVRNPLGGIELFAGILRDEIPADDERSSHVQRIERELGHLKSVVSDFLEYARRPQPELATVDLTEVIGDVIELVRAEAEAGDVSISSALTPVTCRADPGQLRRALLNLARNAVQAAAAGAEPRTVRLELLDDEGAKLEVHNTGAPIPPEALERVFEPFFTTREKGTGLGLAFVREIVGDHHGSIEVSSSAQDGTRFVLRLPPAAPTS